MVAALRTWPPQRRAARGAVHVVRHLQRARARRRPRRARPAALPGSDPRVTANHRAGSTCRRTPAFGLGNLPYGVFSSARRRRPAPAVAIGDRVLDLAAATGDDRVRRVRATLNAVHGPRAGGVGEAAARLTALAHRPRAPRRGRAAPGARGPRSTMHLPIEVADYVDFYSSEHHAENLGRMFRPGLRAADPELEAPADRLPRPRRHGGRLRHAGRPALRPAQGPDGRRARLRPVAAAGHRGRGRLRRRRAVELGHPVPSSALRRPRLRRLPGQRLVGPRHPGLGVRAARPVPRQVLRDLGLAVGRAAGGAGGRPGRRRRRGTRSRCPTSTTPTPPWGLDIALEVRLNGELLSRPPFGEHVLDAGASSSPT